MAYTKEQRLENALRKEASREEIDPNLVKMTKDNEVLYIHPSCVKNHQHLGWKVE